jgi:hypothetical protein
MASTLYPSNRGITEIRINHSSPVGAPPVSEGVTGVVSDVLQQSGNNHAVYIYIQACPFNGQAVPVLTRYQIKKTPT